MIALLIAAAQVSAMLLVGLGLAWLLKGRTASLRHAVMMITLACAAIVPGLGALLPGWTVEAHLLPGVFTVPLDSEILPTPGSPLAGPSHAVSSDQPSSTAAVDSPGIRDVLLRTQSRAWQEHVPTVLHVALAVYAAGLMLSLMGLMIGVLRLRALSRQSSPVCSEAWLMNTAAIARGCGLRRTVHLAQSPHPVLATWGMLRPQLLLPPGIEDWPDDRIRAVLLHELAHVRRNDWIIQLLAGLMHSVYWFNPLVWIACDRLRQECEQACDDAVIEQGIAPTDYAAHLLALARLFARPVLVGAPAMARPSTLRKRVAYILHPATRRAPPARASLLGITSGLLLAAGAIAACNGSHVAPQAESQAALYRPPGGASESAPHVADALPRPGLAPAGPSTVALKPAIAMSAPASQDQPSARAVVADILALVDSALADESTAILDELTYPITGLHHVQRQARAALSQDAGNAASLAGIYIEIINSLVNTANQATTVTLRPRGAALPPRRFDALAAALREKSRDLSGVLMRSGEAASAKVVSSPVNRAAMAALELVQMTRQDGLLVGPRPHNWLVTQLDTLEMAARSAIQDESTSAGVLTMNVHLLAGSIQSTARQADDIARRTNGNPETRTHAASLSTALQDIANRLFAAMSQSMQSEPAHDEFLGDVARSIPAHVPELDMVTLRSSGQTIVASFTSGGTATLKVLLETSPTDVDAMNKEQWAIDSTPGTGVMRERNGLHLHTWGVEGDDEGYRVLTRMGTVVVNLSSPRELNQFVLPVLDTIARELEPQAVPSQP